MTDTIFTLTSTEHTTVYSLEDAYREALANAEAAWRTQSSTTVEDGYTYEQANAAIEQAKQADKLTGIAYTRWQRAIQAQEMLFLTLADETEAEEGYEVETADGLVNFIPAVNPDIDPYEFQYADCDPGL